MSDNHQSRDYYADLGLTPTATAAEIKSAFRRLAQRHHSDKNDGTSKFDGIEFRRIQEAYEKLSSAAFKRENDEKQEQTVDTDTRPFNIFNPRPRASSPIDIPPRQPNTPHPRRPFTPHPNAKFYDVGAEFEEHELEVSETDKASWDPQFESSDRPDPGIKIANGLRVLVSGHPAGKTSSSICPCKPNEWRMQAGSHSCIFCLSWKEGMRHCLVCQAVACAECLKLAK